MALCQHLPELDEIHFPVISRTLVECPETGFGFGHHIQGKPVTVALLVFIPVFKFVFAQGVKRFAQAVWHQVHELGA